MTVLGINVCLIELSKYSELVRRWLLLEGFGARIVTQSGSILDQGLVVPFARIYLQIGFHVDNIFAKLYLFRLLLIVLWLF